MSKKQTVIKNYVKNIRLGEMTQTMYAHMNKKKIFKKTGSVAQVQSSPKLYSENYIYIYMCVCVYIFLFIYICVYIYICVCVCVYIYIYS
jgi:hypothetical protein